MLIPYIQRTSMYLPNNFKHKHLPVDLTDKWLENFTDQIYRYFFLIKKNYYKKVQLRFLTMKRTSKFDGLKFLASIKITGKSNQ